VRRPRADSQSAPGRLRASFTPVLRPVREVQSLDWDRKGRVTPAWTASQEAWPGAEPRGQSLGECRSGAPEGERAPTFGALPRPAHWQAATSAGVARTLAGCASRRSAPLGFFRGGLRICFVVSKPRARPRRENGILLSAPPKRGRATIRSEARARTRREDAFYFTVAGFAPAIHAAATTRKPCGEGQQ